MPSPYQYGRWSRLSRHYVPYGTTVTLTNSFEGGSNGVTLTQGGAGNTSGASGNFFDTVFVGASATLAFDTTRSAHGLVSCQVATGGTATTALAEWAASAGTYPTLWFRQYLYFTGNPASAVRTIAMRSGPNLAGAIVVSAAGNIQLMRASGAIVATFANVIPLGQWFRIEGFFTGDAAAGVISCSQYSPMDSVNATETQTATGQATAGVLSQAWFGQQATVANAGPYWMDDVGISSAGPLGPLPGNAPFYPLNRPAAARAVNLRPGTVGHAAGTYGQTGPPVKPLQRPVRAMVPQPVRGGGQVTGRRGPSQGTGPALKALAQVVASLVRSYPPRGRAAGRGGLYEGPGPKVRQLPGPVRSRWPWPLLTGRSRTTLPPPVAVILPAVPVTLTAADTAGATLTASGAGQAALTAGTSSSMLTGGTAC